MNAVVEHRTRQVRRLCQHCRQRKARFAYHGEVRADRHHTLCFECFRAERNRQQARRLVAMARATPALCEAAAAALRLLHAFAAQQEGGVADAAQQIIPGLESALAGTPEELNPGKTVH